MASKAKTIAIALGLFAALAIVGIIAVKSSNYMDVGQLKQYQQPVKVIVKGKPLTLGYGEGVMEIGETLFKLVCRGVFCVASRVKGPVFGNDNAYAVFVLEGGNGYSVLALYSKREFTMNYGGSPIFSSKVVVEGVYHPDITASIRVPHGSGLLHVIMVSKILEGCHKSYKNPVASS